MTTQHNMPPMPKTWQERLFRRQPEARQYPTGIQHDLGASDKDGEIADLRAHAAALAERIVALEAKCALYAASLKQADERVMEMEAENTGLKLRSHDMQSALDMSEKALKACAGAESALAAARQQERKEGDGGR